MWLADFDESFLVAVGLTSLDPLLFFQAKALDQVLSWIEHAVGLLTADEATLRFAILTQGALFTKVMRTPAETISTVKRYYNLQIVVHLLGYDGVFEGIAANKTLERQIIIVGMNLVFRVVFISRSFAVLFSLQLPPELVIRPVM